MLYTNPRGPWTVYERFQVLRFPLIFLVMLIHNSELGAQFSGSRVELRPPPYLAYLVDILSNGIARIAVPLFFLMSAYLFFYASEFSARVYRRKFKSRVGTLILPYVFWNVTLFVVLYAAQRLPATAVFIRSDDFQRPIGIETFDIIFGFTKYPISYQFWFIRDLIVLVAISPLVYVLVRFVPLLFLSVLASTWILRIIPDSDSSVEALLFFAAGAYLAVAQKSPFDLDRHRWVAAGCAAAVFAVRPLVADSTLGRLLLCVGIVLGLVAALGASRDILDNNAMSHRLEQLGSASFFIFAVHEPTITVLRKLAYRVWSPTELTSLTLYIIVPIATCVIAIAMWLVARRVAPTFLAVVTGGRH